MYGNTEIIQEISDKVGWTQDGCFALLPRSGLLESNLFLVPEAMILTVPFNNISRKVHPSIRLLRYR